MADFASAFLARDQSAATDFEFRVSVGASLRARRTFGVQRTARHTRSLLQSKLVGVRKLLQNWIMPRRPQVFDQAAKDRIQQRIRVHDVEVEWD